MCSSALAALAEGFLRVWVEERALATADDLVVTLGSVAPDGHHGLLVTFGVNQPFRMGDLRAQRRIDAAIRALLAAHPHLEPLRIDLTAHTLSSPDAP